MTNRSTAFTYDARGNMTGDGVNSYTYSSENYLKTGPGGAALSYDPLGVSRMSNTALTLSPHLPCAD